MLREENEAVVVVNPVVGDWRQDPQHAAVVQAATKGGNALKQFQERAIDAIFRGRHVAVAVSTGGGKTAVMLYAILRAARAGPPRVHVMLMPLLSLQRDFKAGYQAWCSDVLFLSVVDESSAKEVEGLMVRTAARVVPEKSVVVLLSPEHLKRLKDALLMARDMVGFFCVDECHTMIGWEGFRPDFTALHLIARDLPTTTFIAASATLLPENERPVLVERLGLEWDKCEVVRVFLGSRQQHVHYVERGMLGVEARTIFGHDRMDMLVFVTAVADLAPARAQIMRWSGLTEHNVRMFCSNMSNEYKAGVDDWLRAPGQGARVLVTTVAFGMGVDLASIKSVVLWTLPRDAPGLFQALGRARPSSDGGPLHLTVVLSGLKKADDQIKVICGEEPKLFPAKGSVMCTVCNQYAPKTSGVPETAPFTCALAGVTCRSTPRMPACFQVLSKNFFSGAKDLLAAGTEPIQCGVCDYCRGAQPVRGPPSVKSYVEVMAGKLEGQVGLVLAVKGPNLKLWCGGAREEHVPVKMCIATERVPQFSPAPPMPRHKADALGFGAMIVQYFAGLGSILPFDRLCGDDVLKQLKKWRPETVEHLQMLDRMEVPAQYQEGLVRCIRAFQDEKGPKKMRAKSKKATDKRNQENRPDDALEPTRKSSRQAKSVQSTQSSQYTTGEEFSWDGY